RRATMESNTHRDRGGWTPAALAYVERVNQTLSGLRDYWPLTLRQVYYQLVAALFIENNEEQYKKLSRILVKARLSGLVTWDALEDRARSLLPSAAKAAARRRTGRCASSGSSRPAEGRPTRAPHGRGRECRF